MLSFLKGKIIKKSLNYVIVDVGNIGYKVFVNEKILSKAFKGEDISFWTHQYVREDSLDLYGFSTEEELDFFELLLSISGVGPKSALSALAISNVKNMKNSIASEDHTLLTKVSGIGQKTAKRVVLELKDKMDFLESYSVSEGDQNEVQANIKNDEIEALVALGYNTLQAREALNKVDPKISDSGQRIKQALKNIKS